MDKTNRIIYISTIYLFVIVVVFISVLILRKCTSEREMELAKEKKSDIEHRYSDRIKNNESNLNID